MKTMHSASSLPASLSKHLLPENLMDLVWCFSCSERNLSFCSLLHRLRGSIAHYLVWTQRVTNLLTELCF